MAPRTLKDSDTRSRATRRAALLTLYGVLFLTFLDTTIVSVTLGSVQSDLHAGVDELQWVVNGYALVFASLMLMAGSIGDRWGRRRLMLGGVAVFCAGSLLAAAASTATTLIAGRVVMGVGAAASEPGTLSMIRQLFPEADRRAHALGGWAAVSGLALASGPVLGGALVGLGSWRIVFWANLAAGVAMLAAVAWLLPESADPRPGRLDLPGFLLGATFLGCGAYAGIAGETRGYDAREIIALFAVSGLALIGFLAAERRARNPMLRLSYLAKPAVGGPLAVAFAIYFGVFSIFFFTALYLQQVVGYSGYRTAGQFAAMTLAMVVGSLMAGRWVARSGARGPMTLGCLLAALGLVLTDHYLTIDAPFVPLSVVLAVAGLGFGVAVVPVTSTVLAAIPARDSGMAASATNTSRQLGAVVGVVALGSLVNAHLTGDLTARLSALGVPPTFQAIVIDAIQTGMVPRGGDANASAAYGPIVNRVIGATFDAFRAGLHQALLVSAVLMIAAAGIAAVSTRAQRTRAGELADNPAPAAGRI